MRTECCECEKTAVRFVGTDPYCRKHIPADTSASECPMCHREQPPNVHWEGRACGECAKTIEAFARNIDDNPLRGSAG